MAELTAIQLKWLRDELGAGDPTDAELQVRYDELASIRDVAIAYLRDRRAVLLRTPLQVSVSGVASINNTENVKALERRISALAQLDDDPTDEPGEDQEGPAEGSPAVIPFRRLTRARGR